MIDERPIKYFFNLKLDNNNKLTLFHKIILLDLNKMFQKVIKKFQAKFAEFPRNKKDISRESNDGGNNKIVVSLEEKSTFDNEEISEMSLVSLLSMKDREGNTPILFAAFRGNLNIIKELINLGVSYESKNKAGLNIIHMAAQSDNPNVIVYFKEKYEMNLFDEDEQGNNSLHWACSSGSKIALDYLLAYINEEEKNLNVINSVNSQGQTALHITILTTGSISTIKKLVKKGIDCKIKDKNNLDVFGLVKNNEKHSNIEKTLIEYTEKNMFGLNYHINDKLNIYYKFILFFILLCFVESIMYSEFMPYLCKEEDSQTILSIVYYSTSIIFLIGYLYIIFSDPGIVAPNKLSWLEILANETSINKMCPYCKIDQTKFSKHCFICNKCIEVYDHHCHWINNCVGHKNRTYFLIFIVLLLTKLFVDFVISAEVLITNLEVEKEDVGKLMKNVVSRKVMALLMMFITAFFFFPVCYLFYRQLTNKSQIINQQKEVQDYYKELKEINKENKEKDH